MKKSLKIAATINLVIALLSYIFTSSIIYPIILTTLSIIYFNYTTKTINYIYKNKTLITLISLFNFFINPISGIILLVGQDKLYQEYKNSKEKEEIKELSSEEKKTSLLLNLGVGLIVLSGIVLISTNWNIITNEMKILILVLFAILFLLLSKISETELKIEILEKNYWLLSMLFIILTILGAGYFQTFSKWLSFYGEGNYLYLALISIMISLLAFITNDKYNNPLYKNICYIGIIGSIISILLQLKVEIEIVIILINIIIIPLNIIKHKIFENNKELIKYITIAFTIINLATILETENIIYVIIIAALNIINATIISIKEGKLEGVYAPLVINASIITTLIRIPMDTNISSEISSIIGTTIYSSIYLINLLKKEINKTFMNVMNIIANIAMLGLIIINIDNKIALTIIATLIVLTSLINNYQKTIKYENILLPIKIMMLIISIILLVQDIINLDISYIMIILYLISFLIYKLTNGKIKKTSLVLYYIFFALALLVNDNNQIIPSIINVVSSIAIFLITKEESKTKERISYIALLITILSMFSYTNILQTAQLNNGIIVLLIYIILTIATRENKKITIINYLSIILPSIIIISDNNVPYEIVKIIENMIGMYAIIMISILLLKNDKDRNILLTILSILLLLNIMFIESWIIGIYVGIVSLSLTMIGFIKKEYKGLFIEGIVMTIINILYQFKYIFKEIPFWIYTLLAGLIIIGFVTYKIIKDNEK